MSLVLLVLLEDNLWAEGMSGADVTCQRSSSSFDSTSMSRRVVAALCASRIWL